MSEAVRKLHSGAVVAQASPPVPGPAGKMPAPPVADDSFSDSLICNEGLV